MANILIDGYNLIGLAHRNLEKARHDLIQQLSRYAKLKGHSITVVFDGWKEGPARETRTKMGAVTVIYSGLGEKADDVIKHMLSSDTKPWITVSTDREIAAFAEKKKLAALRGDEFERKLSAALEADRPPEEEAEAFAKDDENLDLKPECQKGNPKKRSKKDKKKIEALQKL